MSVGLTDEQLKVLEKHINEKWATKKCSLCLQNSWRVSGFTGIMMRENHRTLNLGGPMIPCAAITCWNCGNTVLINLLVAGVYGDGGGE